MKACSAEEMREIDRRAVADYGMPSLLLMENAGRAVARRALDLLTEQRRSGDAAPPVVRIFCGPGNNGGDGLVAARHLVNSSRIPGLRVDCCVTCEPSRLRGDARANLELLEKLGVPVTLFVEGSSTSFRAELVIDALLGTGSRGAPRGAAAEAVRAINRCGVPVLSVDVPSGLDADTGIPAGECVRAVETVTFGLPKVGLLSYPGRELAGALTVAEIGLPRALLEAEPTVDWITPALAAPLWPSRPRGAHKGSSGKLLVLAGSPGMTGAAALCCEAALRAGAGLVTLGIPRSLNAILEVKLTEAMTLPLPETRAGTHCPESLAALRDRLRAVDALAAGPGLGRDPRTGELLRSLLDEAPVPVVVDADGLNLLAPAGAGTFPSRCVITPHPGELARLIGTGIEEIQSNRLEAARRTAAELGCVVVLKGPATVVAAPDSRAAINASGGPALATGGTGDVLTGVVGACLARGMRPFEAAVAAVYLHGLAGEAAAERWGAPGALAGQVGECLPEALRRLRTGEAPEPCRIV